jgi:hypothetical protein
VTIFERQKEDAPSTALVVEPGGGISNISGCMAERANPSMRRTGLAIAFWCEECHGVSELTIEQHKGNTYLKWRGVENLRERLGLISCDRIGLMGSN